ncbi:MAG: ATP-binding cassette domain-containing protein [Ignavibacteria bacterium]|jgi:phospholipid/cholesterol/gamma-HCH transport system ATP-binding protein|nr:ATP-binding cassette domain-containing protein [Ignavibacteria bacterium]MCU7502917.1 ATP-binding cassette domain-containing protein [Ignavibacteria bacterium]MCU7515589.1 ATP-binding cassette domain-containing protein [Ignavibacteria bacterium]
MIEIINVDLNIDGRDILKDVSLKIDKGTTSVILGPSGAGKSTILKVILGLEKINAGSVNINGKNIFELKSDDLLKVRRNISMVFQANALFDSLNVEDNVAYFLAYNSDISKKDLRERVREMLSFVNLSGTESLYPDQLSGGMKKRLAIARALATRPEIILFDEPTTGLDPINSKAILDLINKLRAAGTTSVIVTHILNDAISIGDALTVIKDGRIVASGKTREILQSKNVFVQEFFYEIFQDATLIQNNQ